MIEYLLNLTNILQNFLQNLSNISIFFVKIF